jgi:putative DNA primase/helicase
MRLQVIPALNPRAGESWKRPSQPWREHEQALVSDEVFEFWFGAGGHRGTNIGVICGECSGRVVVIDLDTQKNLGALEWWEGLLQVHNNGMALKTLCQRTGGGGLQLFFRWPEGRPLPSAHKTPIGVDIRGQGGFAVIAPSAHESGLRYQWLDGMGPADIDIEAAPEWLCEAVDALLAKYGRQGTEAAAQPGSNVAVLPLEGVKTRTLGGEALDGREQIMTELVWAAAADFRIRYPVDSDPDPVAARAAMEEAFVRYVSKVAPRDRQATDKKAALEREGRGLSLFHEKWAYALLQWDGKLLEAAKNRPMTISEGGVPRPAQSYEELLEAVEALDRDDAGGIAAIIAATTRLDTVKREKVFGAIKDRTGLGMGAIRAHAKNGTKAEKLDQLGIARMTLEKVGRENVLHSGSGIWRWDPAGVWRLQHDRALKQTAQSLADQEGLAVSSMLVNGVLDLFKNEIHSESHSFNLGDPDTVNCLNGELERTWDGWRLGPHQREHYRTTQIPVAYDPGARAPRFEAFLEEVFRQDADKAEKKQALLELMGYSLMSHARREKFVILIGLGANGKSVLLKVLEALCGPENVAGVQPQNFDNRFQRAHLDQKLANIVTELKQGEVIADAELKAITSGETMTVERKFQPPFDMRPFATCWIATNHMPHTRDFSDALFRRALLLAFNRIFATEEQDPMLAEKLKAELSGILNMVLEAYCVAADFGFTAPESSETAKLAWRMEADQVASFVEDCCVRRTDRNELVGEVFKEYLAWAGEQRISKTMSQKGFRDRLDRLGFGRTRTGDGRFVGGIELVTKLRFHGWPR